MKNKITKYCDWIIQSCLCFAIFCLPFAKAGIETFVWFAIFIWLFKMAFCYRGKPLSKIFPPTTLNKALIIFIIFNAISTIFSVNLGLSLRGFWGKELKFIAIYFMIAEVVNNKKRLNSIIIALTASVVLIIPDAAMQYFRGVDFLKGYEWSRLTASFSTANGFAAWLVVIILLLLGLLKADRLLIKKFRFLLPVLILLLFICLLMTYARGAWIGFIAGVLFMIYYAIKGSALKIKIFFLSVIVSSMIIFFFLPHSIKTQIKTIGEIKFRSEETIKERLKSTTKLNEGSIIVRRHLWREALMIVEDYPLFGCGLNTYSAIIRNYKTFNIAGYYTHNSYLHMAAETGLLGLLAFLWVLFKFFRIGIRHFNQTKNYLVLGLLSGLLAFLVHAFFDTHLYSLQLVVLFWFMMGLTVAVIKIDEGETPVETVSSDRCSIHGRNSFLEKTTDN